MVFNDGNANNRRATVSARGQGAAHSPTLEAGEQAQFVRLTLGFSKVRDERTYL
jgi:hypothetical protein